MVALWLALLTGTAAAETLAIQAARLHPVAGPAIENGVVLVEDGRITAVGAGGSVAIPADATRLEAAVVTPGFIDAHTSVGLAGMYNVPADRDENESTNPDQAELRALDAFNPREPLLRYVLEHGVTVVQTGPGPANPIAGQAGIFRTHGVSADAMTIRAPSAVVFSLGEGPKKTYGAEGSFPSTRMGVAALIRSRLREALRYRVATERAESARKGLLGSLVDAPDYDPGLEVLGAVAAGELPALFTAHRADDIQTALRLARELELDAVLAGVTEGYLVRDPLREAALPVLVGPVMERVSNPERLNASYESPALLSAVDIPIAIRSGFEPYVPRARVVLFEAAIAAANGLGPERALHAITLGPAELLKIDADYGSLEPGKIADLVLFDGDPFEYTTHVEAVIAAGEVVHRRESRRP